MKKPSTHIYIKLVLKCITAFLCIYVLCIKGRWKEDSSSKYLHETSFVSLYSVKKLVFLLEAPRPLGLPQLFFSLVRHHSFSLGAPFL